MTTEAATTTHRRYDRGGGLLRSEVRGSDDALLFEGIVSSEGILEYPRADGTIRRELVTMDALRATAGTLPRSPTTLHHPAEGFINADTHSKLNVGDVDGEVILETHGGFGRVRCTAAARRRDAIQAIESGTARDLSLGYDVKLDETPGVHPVFGRYDARQIGRNVNHLALVPEGRDLSAHVRVDSGDLVSRAPTSPAGTPRSPSREDASMKAGLIALLTSLGVSRLDNEDVAIAEAASILKRRKDEGEAEAAAEAVTLESLKSELVALKAEVATLKAAATTKDGEMAAVAAENEEMKADAKAKADAAELSRLQGVATKVGVKHDGLKLDALRVAIGKTRIDSIDDKTPAAYLDGVLAAVEKDAGKRSDERYKFTPTKRKDAADSEADGKRDDFYNPSLARADEARAATNGSTR